MDREEGGESVKEVRASVMPRAVSGEGSDGGESECECECGDGGESECEDGQRPWRSVARGGERKCDGGQRRGRPAEGERE